MESFKYYLLFDIASRVGGTRVRVSVIILTKIETLNLTDKDVSEQI